MNKFFGIVVLLISFTSCTSNLDFNQINDLKLTPTFIGNFGSFDFQAPQFVSTGVEQNLVSDKLPFNLVSYKSVTDHINRADLEFEFTNTINRAYSISIHFLDDNDAKLYSILVPVPAYSGSLTQVKKTEIFEKTNIDLLRLTKKVEFNVLMLPGIPLNNNSVGSLKMRSSGIVYVQSK